MVMVKNLFLLLSTDNYVLSILYRSVRLTQLAFPLQTPVFIFLFYPCTIFDLLYSKHQCNQIKAESDWDCEADHNIFDYVNLIIFKSHFLLNM